MMKSSVPNNVGMSGFHGGCVDGWMEREKWGERKREREWMEEAKIKWRYYDYSKSIQSKSYNLC